MFVIELNAIDKNLNKIKAYIYYENWGGDNLYLGVRYNFLEAKIFNSKEDANKFFEKERDNFSEMFAKFAYNISLKIDIDSMVIREICLI